MKTTEIMTMLEIELAEQWRKAMACKRQDEHRRMKAKAIETYNKLKKQKLLMAS